MANVYNFSIEELEQYIATYPRISACNRADVELFETLLATKKQQRAVLTNPPINPPLETPNG